MGQRVGKYRSYAELARHEVQGRDYRVQMSARAHSPVLIVAPHGGMIEDGTSEIALLIAAEDHNVFSFEGIKPYGTNRALHITSHLFDHPDCMALAARCDYVLSVHGCRGDSRIHVGGLDAGFTELLAVRLTEAGFAVDAPSERYPGRHPKNVCNRGARAKGAQLEFTYDLRAGECRMAIARSIRAAIAEYCP